MNNKTKKLLENIPKNPWIYKFIDSKWKIIYIWKSVNLKSRVSSYFNWTKKLNFAKQKMVKQINSIETIITNNETESLILETTLIKKHGPKYNILMKDWKNHIYIKITNNKYPKIIKTRFKTSDWTYFWPYTSTNYVNNILKIIKKVYWYWIWEYHFFDTNKSYNLDKYIFKNNLKLEDYSWIINKIKYFLKWNIKEIKEQLEDEMKRKAKELKFEEAWKLKEKIDSIKSLEISQIVRDWVKWNYNIINFIKKYDNFYIWLINIIDWKIVWFYNYDIDNKLDEKEDYIIQKFIENKYIENKESNITYLIPENIKIEINNIKIEIPKIWIKKELLNLCYKNIYDYATKKYINSLSTKGFSKKNMQNLLKILNYKQINDNIIFECNDISHISWNYTVASRSIIEDWKLNNSKYKKFKIKKLDEQKIDDFSSMKEIITRRIKEIEKNNFIPDLIIIDWWKWQLSSVNKIIENYNKNNDNKLKKLQLVWIAKKEEILYTINNWTFSEIKLDINSIEIKLIQRIRDEAHRFAITFNRNSRIKWMKKNILDELPWFWPKTRKKILNKYWNIEKIKWINKEELKSILNKNQIETLDSHWLL